MPVPMAARSKARTVFDCSNTRIVVSNPARGVDLCVCVVLFCVGLEALRRAEPPVQGVLPKCPKID